MESVRFIALLFILVASHLSAELPHRVKVLKAKKDASVFNSLRIVYKEYTDSLLALQTELITASRFEEANTVQTEYHLNLGYLKILGESYQFIFVPTKPLPKEAEVYRNTRNNKISLILKSKLDAYIRELNESQLYYTSRGDLVNARKTTDEMRLTSLELEKINNDSIERKIPNDSTIFRGQKFKVFIDTISWHEARYQCEKRGGFLAEVKDRWIKEFLSKLSSTGGKKLWIGGSQESIKGKWVWTRGGQVSYLPWRQYITENNVYDRKDHSYLVLEYGTFTVFPSAFPKIDGYICQWD